MPSLWDYLERRKIVKEIKQIENSSMADLKNAKYVTNIIRRVGLLFFNLTDYGEEKIYTNKGHCGTKFLQLC